MGNIDLSDPELLEMKFLSNGLEMLAWNTKFLLENAKFTFYSDEMYSSVSRILTAIQLARSQYVNEMRFSQSPFNSSKHEKSIF